MYKGNRLVVTSKQHRIDIIYDIDRGLGNNIRAVAMSSHLGRTSTYQKVSRWFYWHNIVTGVALYIKGCDNCQKHLSMAKKVKEELKNIDVLLEVMKQIGIGICSLPSVDEFEYLIVCTDYFSKWSEAKSNHDKSAPTVAHFFMNLFAGMAVLLSK